jgi:hypothetical protein
MSSFSDTAKRVLEVAHTSLVALEAIGGVLKGLVAQYPAEAQPVIQGMIALIEAIEKAGQGAVSGEDVQAALREFKDSIAANNAAVDAAIAAKFGPLPP